MNLDAIQLTVLGLATHRLAVLFSDDTGPFHVFSKLRSLLNREAKKRPVIKRSDVASGLACLRCSSVWIASMVAAYAALRSQLSSGMVVSGDTFLLAMALSSMAILLNRAFFTGGK